VFFCKPCRAHRFTVNKQSFLLGNGTNLLFARMILDGVAALKFLLGFHLHSFWAVLKAHVSFYRNLGKLIKKRKKLLKLTTVKEHTEIYRRSIMWKFFIQKKRKFSELNFNPEK